VANTSSKFSLRNIVIAVAVIGAAIWVWDEQIKYRVFPKRWAVVEEGKIYRSGQISEPLIYGMLKDHKIARVIDFTCGAPADGKAQKAEREAIEKLNIDSVYISLRGNGTGSLSNYTKAIAEVHKSYEEGSPVLVHCAAGSKRTSGVLLYYLVLVRGQDPEKTVEEMRRFDFGPTESPELIAFLNDNMEEVAKRLVKMGVIESVPAKLPQLPTS